MNFRTAENVKVNTINSKYKQLAEIGLTNLKPFQIHFMEDVVLMKEFVLNQKNTNEGNDEIINAFDMLVNVILDEVSTEIDISVGKRCKNHFNTYLHIQTNSPYIVIGNWNKIEPIFCISDNNYRTNNVLCSINLTLIKTLRVKISRYNNCNVYNISFTYGEIDYDIQMKTTC